jgi:hypothetical protein
MYSQKSYDRRIWKFKERKGWEKYITDKYDVDEYWLNATDESLETLRTNMADSVDKDVEKEVIYSIFDLNLQGQWNDIPSEFHVPTYLFSRLDMDIDSIIKLNFERKEVADMKAIMSENDALLNSAMWNFDRVQYDKELLDQNTTTTNLTIHNIIGRIHTTSVIIDALKIMMTDFFSIYRYKYHKYKHKYTDADKED